MNNVKETNNKLEEAKKQKKEQIIQEPNKFKRFWKFVWFYISYVWIWLFHELKDWRTFVIFISTMLIIGSEVWIPLLIGIITGNSALLAFAGTMEAFWLLPGTPFIPLCIVITLGIKSIIKRRKEKNGKKSRS